MILRIDTHSIWQATVDLARLTGESSGGESLCAARLVALINLRSLSLVEDASFNAFIASIVIGFRGAKSSPVDARAAARGACQRTQLV